MIAGTSCVRKLSFASYEPEMRDNLGPLSLQSAAWVS